MVNLVLDAFDIVLLALKSAFDYAIQLFEAADAVDYLVAAFLFVLVVDFLVMPVRGGSSPSIGEFSYQRISQPNKKYFVREKPDRPLISNRGYQRNLLGSGGYKVK